MTWPDGVDAKIVEVRRGDASLIADPALTLEYGDRVSVIASRQALPALRQHFGDSIKSTTEVSYVSVGLGMSFGVLLGLVPIPIPGLGQFSLGLAGGPLVVALILGKLGRTGPLAWHMPLPANLTLRTFGLTLFLAAVGLGSGAPFVETLAGAGVLFLAIATAIVLGAMLVGFLVGQSVLADGDRRSARHRLRHHRQSGDSGLRQQGAAERSHRRRLCDDLPVVDDSQDPLRADRARAARALGAVSAGYLAAPVTVACNAFPSASGMSRI